MELKEALRVQSHAEVAVKLCHKCKHQGHCVCSSGIGTCIINDAGKQAAQKEKKTKQNNENTRFFLLISPNNVLSSCFQRKKLSKKYLPNLQALSL